MSDNCPESEMKYQEISAQTDIRPIATAGTQTPSLKFLTSIRVQVYRNCDNHHNAAASPGLVNTLKA
jgi:hypothetical protein